MSKQEMIEMPIKDLKVLENSRFRVEDVSDLMDNINQNGLIQPIVVRKSDNVLICGNRRLSACKKLGWKTIPSVVKDVTDKELFLQNLSENIKRKNLKTIEIGRMIEGFKSGKLIGEKMSYKEIAIALGMSSSRVKTCHIAFKTIPKKFYKDISFFSNRKRQYGEIPESVVGAISYMNRRKRMTDEEFVLLLEAVKEKKIQTTEIDLIHTLREAGSSLKDAIAEMDNWVIVCPKIALNKKELAKEMKEQTITSANLVRKALKELNPKIVF